MYPNAHVSKAIELLGGPTQAARRLNLPSYQTAQAWCRQGRVPAKYCKTIERELGGKVKARQLRPDDWHLYWPEDGRKRRAAREAAQ